MTMAWAVWAVWITNCSHVDGLDASNAAPCCKRGAVTISNERPGRIFSEKLVLADRHAAGGSGDRERIDGARQAAEELFRPKRELASVGVTPSPNPPATSEEQLPRRPRVISIQPVTRANPSVREPPTEPTPGATSAVVQQRTPMRQIPASQLGRVQALTSYGMTPRQVAELYKVPIEEVERVRRRQMTASGTKRD
jgi:hypothetical protein